MIQLNYGSAQPIYEQIIMQYKYLMLQGYLKPNDAIPSVRKLAMDLGITPGTVAKAYREMEQQGLIQTVRGKGTFVAGLPEGVRDETAIAKVKAVLEEQCLELTYQGLGKEEVLELVGEIMEGLERGEDHHD